jgi:hypothetical protein
MANQIEVKGYRKSDGTYVEGYVRSSRGEVRAAGLFNGTKTGQVRVDGTKDLDDKTKLSGFVNGRKDKFSAGATLDSRFGQGSIARDENGKVKFSADFSTSGIVNGAKRIIDRFNQPSPGAEEAFNQAVAASQAAPGAAGDAITQSFQDNTQGPFADLPEVKRPNPLSANSLGRAALAGGAIAGTALALGGAAYLAPILLAGAGAAAVPAAAGAMGAGMGAASMGGMATASSGIPVAMSTIASSVPATGVLAAKGGAVAMTGSRVAGLLPPSGVITSGGTRIAGLLPPAAAQAAATTVAQATTKVVPMVGSRGKFKVVDAAGKTLMSGLNKNQAAQMMGGMGGMI